MRNKGWTKLYREQFVHWISEKKPWCDGYAWSYLYSQANHKPKVVNFRNEYLHLKRGQFVTSKIKLKNIFGWTRRHVDNFLKALENDEMLTYRVTNRFTIITIINYDKFQGNGEQDDIQNDKQMTDRLHTDDKQVSTTKNDIKNDLSINNKKISPALTIFNYWKEKLKHKKSLPTKDKLNKINARLKEGYTIEDCKQAIDGCANSEFHQGKNEGKKIYDSIGLIFRNGEKIEEFMNYRKGDKNESNNEQQQRHKQYKELEEEYKV